MTSLDTQIFLRSIPYSPAVEPLDTPHGAAIIAAHDEYPGCVRGTTSAAGPVDFDRTARLQRVRVPATGGRGALRSSRDQTGRLQVRDFLHRRSIEGRFLQR